MFFHSSLHRNHVSYVWLLLLANMIVTYQAFSQPTPGGDNHSVVTAAIHVGADSSYILTMYETRLEAPDSGQSHLQQLVFTIMQNTLRSNGPSEIGETIWRTSFLQIPNSSSGAEYFCTIGSGPGPSEATAVIVIYAANFLKISLYSVEITDIMVNASGSKVLENKDTSNLAAGGTDASPFAEYTHRYNDGCGLSGINSISINVIDRDFLIFIDRRAKNCSPESYRYSSQQKLWTKLSIVNEPLDPEPQLVPLPTGVWGKDPPRREQNYRDFKIRP